MLVETTGKTKQKLTALHWPIQKDTQKKKKKRNINFSFIHGQQLDHLAN